MIDKFIELFKDYINGLNKNENHLIVFKGFPKEWLSTIKLNKLFSVPLDIDLYDLSQKRTNLITEAVTKLNQDVSTYWCTIEELLTIPVETVSAFTNINVLNNNLYQNFYPLRYPIHNIEYIYNEYYDDIEKNNEISNEVQYLNDYFGDIKKTDDGNYFITYTNQLHTFNLFSAFQAPSFEIVEETNSFIELSDNEDPFLKLIQQIEKESNNTQSITFTWKGNFNDFPQNYAQRISILQSLYPKLNICQLHKKTEHENISRIEDYKAILKRYWGFNQFRTLKMYKNVDDIDHPKEISFISQAQIINDLVCQSENANFNESFRDIFVTSSTGAGKSLMFQVPAIYLAQNYNLLTIVISPLIGLMKDQVYGLQEKNVNFAATINSEVSPVEKRNISEQIADGKISILYISPETLLSRSDIKMLIGERKVGLFVIDEAHIVTTWGKAFRSDYWYLGSYLQKLRKEMRFPIATFTATAIYGGVEDMYSETRDSLLLTSPINYFGYVKRDDIKVSLNRIDSSVAHDREYRQQKYALMHERLKRLYKKDKKVLVYFPLVSIIKEFHIYMKNHASEELASTISTYYGSLKKEEKNESFLRFKNKESYIMLATKAFGMGIDIPDIDTVIHFAPTGNVCDYVQEIGRAARDLDEGKAVFDFLSKDFNHVKRLHGISTIKKSQLIQVMDKIMNIYSRDKNKNKARNLLVSSEEFRYIFERNSRSDMDEDIDNKLKTALLLIEKDFINRIGYSPIIARPRSIFSIEYIKVKREIEADFQKYYSSYVRKIRTIEESYFGGIYKIDLKRLWEDRYKDISFPNFKYLLYQKDEKLKFKYIEYFESVYLVEMDLKAERANTFLFEVDKFVNKIEEAFNPLIISQAKFTVEELATSISKLLNQTKYQAETFSNQLIQSIISYQSSINHNRNHRINLIKESESLKGTKFQVYSGLNEFTKFLRLHIRQLIQSARLKENVYEVFLLKSSRLETEKTFISLGLFEMLDLLLYEVKGGNNPEIFIRVNSQLQIESTIKQPERYQNTILNNVHKRHKISVAMLTYLFNNQVDTEEFWNSIEDYFLGRVPQEVLESI